MKKGDKNIKRDCEFYDFCYNINNVSYIKYCESPCNKCINESIGEESIICDKCCGCNSCNYKPIK